MRTLILAGVLGVLSVGGAFEGAKLFGHSVDSRSDSIPATFFGDATTAEDGATSPASGFQLSVPDGEPQAPAANLAPRKIHENPPPEAPRPGRTNVVLDNLTSDSGVSSGDSSMSNDGGTTVGAGERFGSDG